MSFKIEKDEYYRLVRKVTDLKAKISVMESEFVYMPVSDVSDYLNRVELYISKMTSMKQTCMECLEMLNSFNVEIDLFHKSTNKDELL